MLEDMIVSFHTHAQSTNPMSPGHCLELASNAKCTDKVSDSAYVRLSSMSVILRLGLLILRRFVQYSANLPSIVFPVHHTYK